MSSKILDDNFADSILVYRL